MHKLDARARGCERDQKKTGITLEMAACLPCEVSTDATPPAFFFSRGRGTFVVERPLPVAARKKLVAKMADQGAVCGVIMLRGGKSLCRNDTDHEELFRQESYFAHLFGVQEPDCWGIIELPAGRATLLVPKLDASYAVWMGEIKSCSQFQRRYFVDACAYTDALPAVLKQTLESSPGPVHVLSGTNSDSGADLFVTLPVLPVGSALPPGASFDKTMLYEAAAECRVAKSAEEIELMRYVSWVSSAAHASVMRDTRPGMYEYQLEALFLFHCAYHGGCRHAAYTCICACGPNSAVLHYGHAGAPNDRELREKDMALLDMGCEYMCYASDITCSFPVSGTFSADQRMIYETVLDAQRQIFAMMRPGVAWQDMHRLMWRVTLTHLRAADLLVGDVDDMLAANLGAVFIPSGLGHLIGIDTHDVGGYLTHTPARSSLPGLSKLRTSRILEPGMVLTVEPGCYFIDALLDSALADPTLAQFLVPEALERFRGFGGVRLEDVVAITDTSIDNLTTCPRTVTEVEAVMRGGEWPPQTDAAPWLMRRWTTLDRATGRMVPDDRIRVETGAGLDLDADF